jgi:hypothetical protein
MKLGGQAAFDSAAKADARTSIFRGYDTSPTILPRSGAQKGG